MKRDEIFPGHTEMARRMRELDWSKTSLGPVEQWPQSLRTSVSICLDCAFPIVLWWGPELVILYNDEYISFLGPTKHPSALGKPSASVWSEIWDVVGPMLKGVMDTGVPTRSRDLMLHIVREGYAEEAYFSFSYSPINDETGGVGGVFCPCIETTEKVIGERRLRTLRDLASRCKGAESEHVAYDAAAQILAANPHDVPFAMIYQIDERQSGATLKGAAGITPGCPASPEHVSLDDSGDGVWMLNTVARSGRIKVVSDLSAHFHVLPTGAWKVAPQSAMVLPVSLPGQEHPRAILVAAISPMRALDEDYLTFFGLVATQLASALADAQALEEQRRRAEALAELDRAKTTFFSNVSHEFRTPLTLMIGPLEDLLAHAHGALPDDIAETVLVTHRNSLRLLKLVNTLLDFSRIEAGRIEASYEALDLATSTVELASMFDSEIEKAKLRLVLDCEPLPEPVYVDRDMWEKIVLNLLSNAFKFTFDGSITVALRWHGDHVELSVTDTGIGIAESDLPRMFERFHRVKNARARTHEGTGIGLALVQELARLHGGSVAVESREGRGTTFTVSIRTGRSHLPPDRIAASRQLSSTSVGAASYVEEALRWLPGNGEPAAALAGAEADAVGDIADTVVVTRPEAAPRLLLADDNADMRDYLSRILGQRYQIDAVGDGRDALECIHRDPPDLVLTDVMMPNLDGFGLLAAIRASARSRSLPVILLSARAGEEARIEGLRAGADEYLVKPFSARELLARVDSQLQLARLRRDADRRKDEFLALLAHELRNPLAPIRTGLELMRVSGNAPATVERVRAMMERQVSHMVRLTEDLLDISRITSGKIVLQRRPTPLADVVQSAIDAQHAALDSVNISLTVDLPAASCVLDVDPTRFVQVVSNIVHNALKFTSPGGRVRVSAETRGSSGAAGELVLTVADTGIGISKEMLPRVFELFTQGEQPSAHAQSGLGIGLALARRLVEMHGGRLEAQSDGPGCGSAFIITMPLAGAVENASQPQPATMPLVTSRVVIIDDNRDAADTMSMLVEALGGSVRVAYDGESGLQAIAEFQPSIVFMDIGMPGIDGYEACRRIRGGPSGTEIAIVALTGWGQAQDKERAFEAGFDAHLTKPVDPAVLGQLLASHGVATLAGSR
jgi:signal transduction histidine kinase